MIIKAHKKCFKRCSALMGIASLKEPRNKLLKFSKNLKQEEKLIWLLNMGKEQNNIRKDTWRRRWNWSLSLTTRLLKILNSKKLVSQSKKYSSNTNSNWSNWRTMINTKTAQSGSKKIKREDFETKTITSWWTESQESKWGKIKQSQFCFLHYHTSPSIIIRLLSCNFLLNKDLGKINEE